MSRPRDRASSAGLLPHMKGRRWADGKTFTYRYHPIGGEPMNLGQDRKAAIQQVLDITSKPVDSTNTLKWVWNKHIAEDPRWKRVSQLSKDDYTDAWSQIRKTFGAMQASAIESSMVARYVRIERKNARTHRAGPTSNAAHCPTSSVTGFCSGRARSIRPSASSCTTASPGPTRRGKRFSPSFGSG